jgi:hypothetical protein
VKCERCGRNVLPRQSRVRRALRRLAVPKVRPAPAPAGTRDLAHGAFAVAGQGQALSSGLMRRPPAVAPPGKRHSPARRHSSIAAERWDLGVAVPGAPSPRAPPRRQQWMAMKTRDWSPLTVFQGPAATEATSRGGGGGGSQSRGRRLRPISRGSKVELRVATPVSVSSCRDMRLSSTVFQVGTARHCKLRPSGVCRSPPLGSVGSCRTGRRGSRPSPRIAAARPHRRQGVNRRSERTGPRSSFLYVIRRTSVVRATGRASCANARTSQWRPASASQRKYARKRAKSPRGPHHVTPRPTPSPAAKGSAGAFPQGAILTRRADLE